MQRHSFTHAPKIFNSSRFVSARPLATTHHSLTHCATPTSHHPLAGTIHKAYYAATSIALNKHCSPSSAGTSSCRRKILPPSSYKPRFPSSARSYTQSASRGSTPTHPNTFKMDASAASNAFKISDITSILSKVGLQDVPKQPQTYPESNVFDIYRSHITDLLSEQLKLDKSLIYPTLAWTAKPENGDLQLAVPALRQKGRKPQEFAEEIGKGFPESPLVKAPVVNGTFVGFFFKPEALTQLVVPMILRGGKSYGFNPNFGLKDPANPDSGRKKLIVEFSSPNIAKPFHAGHLRSTIIGGFLANLYEGAGWDVTRMNYLGDWGKQYGVLAVGYDKFGNEEELQTNPIGHLYDVYVKISAISREEEDEAKALKEQIKTQKEGSNDTSELEAKVKKIEETGVDQQARDYFKRMVDGEPKALGIWKRFRDLSIEKYKQVYARLNIQYDDYSGESQVKDESMDEAARVMEEKGVSENSDGAVIVDLTKYSKKLGKAVVKKKDGTSLYLTRDLGAAYERMQKYAFDKMIYVVASQQDLHLAQLFKIQEAMGRKDISDKCVHINFGMVKGMSTRKGTAKFLDDILRDVQEKMHDVMRTNENKYAQVENPEKTADTLGISAVMVQDMKGKRINNYDFDMNRMTSFEGDTGPYLQYAHARLNSILRKAKEAAATLGTEIPSDLSTVDLSTLTEAHATDLVRQLASWPDVFINTTKTQEPATVLTFLFKMSHAVSSSYDHLVVVHSAKDGDNFVPKEVNIPRLALYSAARQVLNNGMRLLGLSPVERM